MLSGNEFSNVIMILPPEKRNAILKIIGLGEDVLAPRLCCKHDPQVTEFFCYAIEGIKYCDCDTTLDFYLEYLDDKISDWTIKNGRIPEPELEKERVIASFHDVQKDMLHIGWDGDYSQDPSVLFLPCPESGAFALGFVWKQHRDGLTFIASPVPLPWLGEAKIKKGSPRFGTDKYRHRLGTGVEKGEVQ